MKRKQTDNHGESTIPDGAPPSSANPVGARLPTSLPRIPYLWSLPTGSANDGSVVDNGCMFQKQQQENSISVAA